MSSAFLQKALKGMISRCLATSSNAHVLWYTMVYLTTTFKTTSTRLPPWESGATWCHEALRCQGMFTEFCSKRVGGITFLQLTGGKLEDKITSLFIIQFSCQTKRNLKKIIVKTPIFQPLLVVELRSCCTMFQGAFHHSCCLWLQAKLTHVHGLRFYVLCV